MTDRVILGNPFMCLLYSFTVDSKGITTHPFGQPIKFKFFKRPEPREISCLQDISVSKTLNLIQAKINHLNYLQDDLRYKRNEEKLACKDIQIRSKSLKKNLSRKSALICPPLFGIERDTTLLSLMSRISTKKISQPRLDLSKWTNNLWMLAEQRLRIFSKRVSSGSLDHHGLAQPFMFRKTLR